MNANKSTKWAQCDETIIQKTVRTAHLSVHSFDTQYNTEQF